MSSTQEQVDALPIKLKWKMINFTTFIAEQNGLVVTVKAGAAFGSCYWGIVKDGIIIDEVYRHNTFPSGELHGKVQAEKYFNQYINQNK